MARNLWEEVDDEEEVSGEYVGSSGKKFPLIPHETRLRLTIEKAEWKYDVKDFKDNENLCDCISMQLSVDDGEFKNQKIFPKFLVDSGNEEQSNKHLSMLMAIDFNAGGKIMEIRKRHKRKPTDEELSRHLVNKSFVGVIGKTKWDGVKDDTNYLLGVSSGKKSSQPAPAKQPVKQQAKPAAANYGSDEDEDSIPFS